MIDFEHTIKTLATYGTKVVNSARRNLGKNSGGPLAKSIKVETKVSKNSFELNILMNDYGKFHDQGVKGHGRGDWTPKRPKKQQASRSPFKYKTGPGKETILKSMVEKPSFRTRDINTGRFTPKTESNKNQAAYLIARSMGRFGVPGTKFMTRAVNSHSKTLVKNLGEAWVADQKPFIDSIKKSYL